MDPTQIKKIQTMNRYKSPQFLDNLYFFSLASLTCILFCCITFSLPYLSSMVRVFFLVRIPTSISTLLSSKFLFIIGNLIVAFLTVKSRILSSTNDVYYDECIKRNQTQRPHIPTPEVKITTNLDKHVVEMDMTGEYVLGSKGKGWVEEATETRPGIKEDNQDEGGGVCLLSSSDALNKRADAFIARVNKQRKHELALL